MLFPTFAHPSRLSRQFGLKIFHKIKVESYTPRTWRTHPLHLIPVEPYVASEPSNKKVLDWIFLISSLNFSFWSSREGHPDRYGVEWKSGWDDSEDNRRLWTGYWSLVAALNRGKYFTIATFEDSLTKSISFSALHDDNIPISDPYFYSSKVLCPDSLIASVFRPASQCSETVPLLQERISVMREVGFILCNVSFSLLIFQNQRSFIFFICIELRRIIPRVS